MGALHHQAKRRKLNPETKSAREFSMLETLPVEILEEIFLESKNVQLLHVSETLRQRLSSEYVRKEILAQCFRDRELHEDESLYTELLPASRSPKQGQLDESRPFQHTTHGCDASMRNLVLLLEEEWVTMDLVRSVVVDWMYQVCSTEVYRFFREFNYPQSDLKEALAELRHKIDKSARNMLKEEIHMFRKMEYWPDEFYPMFDHIRKTLPKCPWTFSWPKGVTESVLAIGFLENAMAGKTPLGYIRVTVAKPGGEPGMWRHMRTFERRFVTWRGSNRMLPARLLRGPWTQDRGDLLKFLLDQCDDCENLMQRNLCARQLQAASEGLMQALRDDNHLATHTLLGRSTAATSKLSLQLINENSFAAEYEAPHILGSPRRLNAWKRFSWAQEEMPCIRVALTTEHLAEIINNFDQHMTVSVQALGHLAHPHTKIPDLPPGFMAKLQLLVARDWERSGKFTALIAESLERLYKEFVAKGVGCMGVALTNRQNARTMGASVSLYASHSKMYHGQHLCRGVGGVLGL